MDGSFLQQAAVFLAAAAIAAPVGRWLKLSSVIGYLGAGILIGPYGLGYVQNVFQVEGLRHIAELGIALLLFLIGLELRPLRIWGMRRSVFGAGGAQLVLTAAALGAVALYTGLGATPAIVLGLALAMSSTAFALQVLEEKGELKLRHGRLAFSILLMQDLAAIPLLAIVPLLGMQQMIGGQPDAFFAIFKALAIIAAIILAGRFGLSLIYYLVAKSGVREALTATALLIVVGVALLMQAAGLSAALGAFIAGALLADSDYRHQIEADVAPFESLLLGLFFTTIGMSLNLTLLGQELWWLLAMAAGLLVVKGLAFYGVGLWQGLEQRPARRLAMFASQGGEFAFVVLALAAGVAIIEKGLADRLAVVVTLSMVATPIVLLAEDWLTRFVRSAAPSFETPPAQDDHVVIAGFGRFGQIVARVLRAKRIPFTALDISPDQIQLVRRFGNRAYFGDASRLDILEAANAGKARAIVIAIDDVQASLRAAEIIRTHFPTVPVYARARNRQHVYRLMDTGITKIRRETFQSALVLTSDVLRGLGLKEAEVRRVIDTFAAEDRKRLYENYKHASDGEKLEVLAREAAAELETILAEDEKTLVEDKKVSAGEAR